MNVPDCIEIVGADANNLRGIGLEIPVNALTAIVGVSGSGKSSLIDDTLGREAASRMRRFIDVETGPSGADVTAYIGQLPPAVTVGQRAFQASSRSTVGTATPLLRLLRRLFVRFGEPFADDLGKPLPAPGPEVFAGWLSRHAGGRATVWAVPVRQEATTGESAVRRLAAAGLAEAVVFSETDRGRRIETGTPMRLNRFRPLRADVRHTIEAQVGDVVLGPGSGDRLLKLLELAWAAGNGGVFVELSESRHPELARAFSFGLDSRVHRVHPDSPHVFRAPGAHLLSFNAPLHEESGACPVCAGLGTAADLDETALVTHPERSMHEGALALWTAKNYRHVNIQHSTIEGLRGRAGFDPDLPWLALPESARALILDGCPEPVADIDPVTRKKASLPHRYDGFRKSILERAARPTAAGEALRPFVGSGPCKVCAGTRWNPSARALRVAGRTIDQLLSMPFSALQADLCDPSWRQLENSSGGRSDGREALRMTANVARIAESFVNMGLGHLSGDRSMLEVSDGESRRIRLAAVLNSRLTGMLVVLDEPGRGLHEADLARLGESIVQAATRHTVVMSEHRQSLVRQADHIVELGPGAGPAGGRIIDRGAWQGTGKARPSVTGRSAPPKQWVSVRGARINNVSVAEVRIPLGTITCVAGVSGSGKSSFVRGVLVPALRLALPREQVDTEDFRMLRGTWQTVKGAEPVSALHALDQSPVPAQRRSLVATFLDVAAPLRQKFAAAPQASALGLLAADFGTNSGRGRCQHCLGVGTVTDGGPCPVCGGLRFGMDVLSVRLHGLNMAELLAMPVSELGDRAPSLIASDLAAQLAELGIGHLALGRSLDTLSGGEIQRLRIARALSRHGREGAFFVIDEPACGLHPEDVDRLYQALRHIVAKGANTVVVVEHEPALLARSDHIIEFGPGGGPAGGHIIAAGVPSVVSRLDTPTGLALRARATRKANPAGAREVLSQVESAASLAVASGARAEIRQILGHDVAPPDDGPVVRPAAIFPARDDRRRAHELADLDRAIASVALDAFRQNANDSSRLLDQWRRHPDAQLYVNPLLDAVEVWGRKIPVSVVQEVNIHAAAMGLGPPAPLGANALEVRMTGPRLWPGKASDAAFDTVLAEAALLGNGYVELVGPDGAVLASAGDRLIDRDTGCVGPRRPGPAHFSRLGAAGRCRACNGTGTVPDLAESLLLGDRRLRVSDEGLIGTHALAVLRGVRRSTMLPFFRRMVAEGLWVDLPWTKMPEEQRLALLQGFWIRPGHGTFLKEGKGMDGSEVGHWLSWDGLITSVLQQADRSGNSEWRDAIRTSCREAACPYCKGSGLARHAHLLPIGPRTLADWTASGTVAELLDALEGLEGLPPRAERTRVRIAACLKPFRSAGTKLLEIPAVKLRQEVLTLTARQFTGLSTVFT